MAWFGIQGIGSIYYLMYTIEHGVPSDLARQFIGLTLSVIAVSVFIHGISVTPLMETYQRAVKNKRVAGWIPGKRRIG